MKVDIIYVGALMLCMALFVRYRKSFAPPHSKVTLATFILPSSVVATDMPQTVKFTTICEKPKIITISNFLTSEECQWLIDHAEPKLARSKVQTGISPDRTSHTTFLTKGGEGPIKEIEQRASLIAQVPTTHLEPLQVVRYKPGEFYKHHYDYFEKSHSTRETLKRYGQRTTTLFVYLNDMQPGETGGHTSFDKIGLTVSPVKGTAVLWHNTQPDGKVDEGTFHGGDSPVVSTKYGLNIWVREKAWK